MKMLSKVNSGFALAAVLSALTLPANAMLLTYDDLLTGATPSSGTPWLTADITNLQDKSGVSMTLDVGVSSPEFVTDIFFSLLSTANLSKVADPATSPDIALSKCNSASSAPANAGPWQLCLAFAPNLQVADPSKISFTLLGLLESDFVANSAGWFSVAHIQGVQPNCSAWVGAYSNGTVAPSSGGSCASVPEPETWTLLSTGVIAMGLAGFFRRRRAAR
jgi:hypothetical protein